MVRTLAVLSALAAALLAGAACWLYRRERRLAVSFRERVLERLRAGKRGGG